MNEKKEKKLTKTDKVLRHLRKNGSITSLEAIELYNATRLSGIIYVLRNRGYDIVTETVKLTDRFGDESYFGKYVLNGYKIKGGK